MDAPIELILEDDVLVAREFSIIDGSDGDCGVSVRCSDGSESVHVHSMEPTEREFYGFELPQHRILYAKKRALVIEQASLDPDDLPWVEYDPNGNPVAGTDSEARLEAWLNQVVTDERLDGWGEGRNSEYGVALDLLDALPESARGTLGLKRVDLGGPASSVPAVRMTGSLEQFNWIMRLHKLPYVLVTEHEEDTG
jgi:hypothetical protein